MTTQEKREFNLTLTLETDKIYNFLSKMDATQFVNLHQDSFKDHYLREPKILVDNSIYDDLELNDIIREKYIEFFTEIGLDAAYKWLNPSLSTNWVDYLKTEDYSMNDIMCEIGHDDAIYDDDFDNDNFYELYGEIVSGYGLSHFIIEIVELYYDYMNDLQNNLVEL